MSEQLICNCLSKIKSVALLDEFEQRDSDGERVYQSLLMTDCFSIRSDDAYTVSLVLQRWDLRESFINDFMTFTRFKKMVAGRCFEVSSEQTPAIVRQTLDLTVGESTILFPNAVLLHAQNSGNRAGFGDSSSYRGTRYGETCTYMFTTAISRRKEL